MGYKKIGFICEEKISIAVGNGLLNLLLEFELEKDESLAQITSVFSLSDMVSININAPKNISLDACTSLDAVYSHNSKRKRISIGYIDNDCGVSTPIKPVHKP